MVCAQCGLISHFAPEEAGPDARCEHCGEAIFQGRVFDLHAANFDLHVRANHLPLVVVFWAPWCKPCHTVLALAERAARAFEPRIRFSRVNTDNERGLVSRFGVRGIPTVLLFRRGREAVRRIGKVDLHSIAAWADA